MPGRNCKHNPQVSMQAWQGSHGVQDMPGYGRMDIAVQAPDLACPTFTWYG